MIKRFYTEKELCEIFHISHNTVRKYYQDAMIRIGRCIRYDYRIVERINNDTIGKN